MSALALFALVMILAVVLLVAATRASSTKPDAGPAPSERSPIVYDRPYGGGRKQARDIRRGRRHDASHDAGWVGTGSSDFIGGWSGIGSDDGDRGDSNDCGGGDSGDSGDSGCDAGGGGDSD